MLEYDIGDTVRLTKDENVLIGKVEDGFRISTALWDYPPTSWFAWGWAIEVVKPAVELPTEQGYYLDIDGDIWLHDGRKLELIGEESLFDSIPEDYAPFARLYTLEDAGQVFWDQLIANDFDDIGRILRGTE